HTYLPMGDEVDHASFIGHCLKRGITVVTSKTLPKRQLQHLVFEGFDKLEKGVYGTLHPMGNAEWKVGYDLIIVPGLAFDKDGNRVGYGAGYYDSFLAEHPEALKVAVCFPEQLLEYVPSEPFDVRVDKVVTG